MIRRSTTSIWLAAVMSSVLGVCVLAIESSQEVLCPPALFSFGTSLSDTGNRNYILPGDTFADLVPYGESFFGHPEKRFSDGRLILDFIASALDFPFIEPFLTDEAPYYTHGVNLPSRDPWHYQLVYHIASVTSHPLSPTSKAFDEGLYIVFFGRNDFTYYFPLKTPAEVLETVVPKVVQVIVEGIQKLYENGARSFMVFNVNPQGCQPQYLTFFGDLYPERDENGCMAQHNSVIKAFNSLLWGAVQSLRNTLTDSTIYFADFYGICKEVFDNPQQFGFAPDTILVSCCGTGGKYNYDPIKRCGYQGTIDGKWVDVTQACDNPNEYISWDGVHFTEAFYKHVARRLLTGKFLDPPVDMTQTCNLDFSSFDKDHPDKSSK